MEPSIDRANKYCSECGVPLHGARVTGGRSPLADADAEYRQVTAVFCDLERSVELYERLKPAELRELTIAYQDVCSTVVEGFDGSVARYFGDGILICSVTRSLTRTTRGVPHRQAWE